MNNQQIEWASTMSGTNSASGIVTAHSGAAHTAISVRNLFRLEREQMEELTLSIGATRSQGAGNRARPEEPDPFRTCFERDRDRILHASAFRRLAGKTQVFILPEDHQRTRLTHAIEVAQVATAISRALGLNVALTEAIALGHDCGHGPGGHASEEALSPYVDGGYHHAVWGADVALASLNLCEETLDGIRNHSWSRPAPMTPEGEVVSWADRFAYCTADLDDAIHAGIVTMDQVPTSVRMVLGTTQSHQIDTLINALITTTITTGHIGLDDTHAGALSDFRSFNYDHIYTRPASLEQAEAVIDVLRALVEAFIERPDLVPSGFSSPTTALGSTTTQDAEKNDVDAAESRPDAFRAVAYVAGMTDRYAFGTAVDVLDWPRSRLPEGFDLGLFARDDADDLAVPA